MLNVYLIFPLCILNLKCGFSVFVDFLSGFSVLPPNLVRFCGFGNPSRPPPHRWVCTIKRKKLFVGTVPTNKKLSVGTVPTNKKLFVGTVPVNKKLFVGTVPTDNFLFIGTIFKHDVLDMISHSTNTVSARECFFES